MKSHRGGWRFQNSTHSFVLLKRRQTKNNPRSSPRMNSSLVQGSRTADGVFSYITSASCRFMHTPLSSTRTRGRYPESQKRMKGEKSDMTRTPHLRRYRRVQGAVLDGVEDESDVPRSHRGPQYGTENAGRLQVHNGGGGDRPMGPGLQGGIAQNGMVNFIPAAQRTFSATQSRTRYEKLGQPSRLPISDRAKKMSREIHRRWVGVDGRG